MKYKNLILTAFTALALAALAGCSTETELLQETPDAPVPEGMARIEFSIKGVKTGISYAGTVQLEPAEAKINDVTAYLFETAGADPTVYSHLKLIDVVTATVKESGAVGNFLMPTNGGYNYYHIVFVANKACYNAALNNVVTRANATADKPVTTYGEFTAIETLSNTAIMGSLATAGLPMCCLKEDVTVPTDGETENIGELFFTRPLARFDIDNQAVHSFRISSVVLSSARTTSPLNASKTPGNVSSGALTSIEYSPFISDVNEKLAVANPDGTNTKLRPAFYAAPGLEADGSLLRVKGKLRTGLDEVDREYTIPLVNKTDKSLITLAANKRYRVTLKMDKGSNIIGEVEVDLGAWEEADADPDFAQDMNCFVMPASINIEAIYTKEVRTFEVPFGTTSFEFNMLSAPNDVTSTSGVVTGVESTPATLGVNALKYKVAVDGSAAGRGTFVFTLDNKEYTFNVVVLPRVTYNVNGTEVEAAFTGGISKWKTCPGVYWAPVNLGATTAEEPGFLYQFGRMKGWPDAATAKAAHSDTRIPIADSETGGNDAKFIGSATGGVWWNDSDPTLIDNFIADWGEPSNGSSHPCPAGWRLPTVTEFTYLIEKETPIYAEVGSGVYKASMLGITLVRKEMISPSGVITTGVSYYWLSDDRIYFGPDKFSNYISSPSQTSANGCYIRCVKDKAPLY